MMMMMLLLSLMASKIERKVIITRGDEY